VGNDTSWSARPSLDGAGRGLVGHAGAVLLRKAADVCGLTAGLGNALARRGFLPGWDRGVVWIQVAVVIALGGRFLADIELLGHHAKVFGPPASDSTVRRALAMADDRTLRKMAKARAAARRQVWAHLQARPGAFPWLTVAGKTMAGVVVIDIDATIIIAHSEKAGAAPTFKNTYGHHPLIAECDNTGENLSVLLRNGNAGSNTVADHLTVLRAAIEQIPPAHRGHLLIRVDGAGATHGLLEHLTALNTRRRTVEFSVGWFIDQATESVIAALPATAWERSCLQNGDLAPDTRPADVAEITGLAGDLLTGWPKGLRLIARRTRISRRHEKNLTDYERATGWHYAVFATATTGPGIHAQWLDARHRAHACVEIRESWRPHVWGCGPLSFLSVSVVGGVWWSRYRLRE
jgi:DDE family transposase